MINYKIRGNEMGNRTPDEIQERIDKVKKTHPWYKHPKSNKAKKDD